MIVSHSSLAAYRSCPRYYHHRFEEGWAAAHTPAALTFGRAVDEVLTCALNPTAPRPTDVPAVALALLAGYRDHWYRDHWRDSHAFGGTVVGTQVPFATPLINPDTWAVIPDVVLVGTIDAIINVDGKFILVDHKTTSRIDDAYFARLAVDSQVSQYYVGAESLGYDAAGWIHNVIRKPSIKQRKDESEVDYIVRLREDIASRPGWYYQRFPVTRSDGQIANHLRNVCAEIRRIALPDRPQNPDACFKWGGRPCDFWPCCSTGTTPEQHPDTYIHDLHHTQYEEFVV